MAKAMPKAPFISYTFWAKRGSDETDHHPFSRPLSGTFDPQRTFDGSGQRAAMFGTPGGVAGIYQGLRFRV